MPRITVYVPDDLKAHMDDASDNLNWSAVAQLAFRGAIAIHKLKKDPTDMTNVIERLRASKQSEPRDKPSLTARDVGANGREPMPNSHSSSEPLLLTATATWTPSSA